MSHCVPCSTGVDIPTTPPFPLFPPPVGSDSAPGGGTVVDPCAGVNPAPSVLTDFTAVATGSQGQFYSQCAYLWAMPGFDILIPPFGRVSVTAVQDNIVSYINRTIPEGTTIVAGTRMGTASGWDFGPSVSGDAVDFLIGSVGGYPRLIAGSTGMMMQRVVDTDSVIRWKPVQPAAAGFKYYPLATPTVFFSSTSDLTWTGNLPGMPAGNVPCVPVINVSMRFTMTNTSNYNRKVELNGFPIFAVGSYYLTGKVYEYYQPAALPGFGLCMAGNPVTVNITDTDAVARTLNAFSLAIVGWHY